MQLPQFMDQQRESGKNTMACDIMQYPQYFPTTLHTVPDHCELNANGQLLWDHISKGQFMSAKGYMTHHTVVSVPNDEAHKDDVYVIGIHWKEETGSSAEWITSPVLLFVEDPDSNLYAWTTTLGLYSLGSAVPLHQLISKVPSLTDWLLSTGNGSHIDGSHIIKRSRGHAAVM